MITSVISYYIAASNFLYVMMQRIHDKYVNHNFIVLYFCVHSFFCILEDYNNNCKPAFHRGVIAELTL